MKRLLLLAPTLLIAACAPTTLTAQSEPAAPTASVSASPSGSSFGVSVLTKPGALNAAPAPAPDPASAFRQDPTTSYWGLAEALRLPEQKSAVAGELNTLKQTMAATPYEQDASRTEFLKLTKLNNALSSEVTANFKQLLEAIQHDAFTGYLFRFPGTRTIYELGQYRREIAATVGTVGDPRKAQLESDLADVRFESETARGVSDYLDYFGRYAEYVRAESGRICATQKFNCVP